MQCPVWVVFWRYFEMLISEQSATVWCFHGMEGNEYEFGQPKCVFHTILTPSDSNLLRRIVVFSEDDEIFVVGIALRTIKKFREFSIRVFDASFFGRGGAVVIILILSHSIFVSSRSRLYLEWVISHPFMQETHPFDNLINGRWRCFGKVERTCQARKWHSSTEGEKGLRCQVVAKPGTPMGCRVCSVPGQLRRAAVLLSGSYLGAYADGCSSKDLCSRSEVDTKSWKQILAASTELQ